MKKINGDNCPERKYGYAFCIDDTAAIMCECGTDIPGLIDESKITRCPKCGRGYKVEFVVWQYEPGEGL